MNLADYLESPTEGRHVTLAEAEHLFANKDDLLRAYTLPDFVIDLTSVLSQLSSATNKSYVVYDEFKQFLRIENDWHDDGQFYIKRNGYSVLLLLMAGYQKNEIMDILKISRSYLTLVINDLREKMKFFKHYNTDIDGTYSSVIIY